jgi:tetratricopeptide (TPR) repeat protein
MNSSKPDNKKKKQKSHLKDKSGDIVYGDKIKGDKVTIGEVKDSGQVAIGKQITQIGTVFLNVFHANLKPVLFLLVLTLLGVAFIAYSLLRSQSKPKAMSGTFNIAIAPFEEVHGNGNLPSETGKNVAGWLESLLSSQQSAFPPGSDLEVWGPGLTGPVSGNSPEQRASQAAALAQRIDAHILIYGTIEENQSSLIVTPEFYVNPESFQFAEEVTGSHQLGTPLLLPGNAIKNPVLNAQINQDLNARALALSEFTIGLSYFFLRDYQAANNHFLDTQSEPSWDSAVGPELLYLFLGNTALNLHNYSQAHDWYEKVLSINSSYSRAYVGLGLVEFQQALLPLQDSNNPQVDLALLDQSIKQFQAGMSAADKPENVDIDWKIHFGLGRAYLIKGQFVDPIFYSQAEAELQQVTRAYEAGQVSYPELAAQSYGQLGLLYYIERKTDPAIDDLVRAIKLGQDNQTRANWAGTLAILYKEKNDSSQQAYYAELARQLANVGK